MKARITFRSEVFLEGETREEIAAMFEAMDLFSDEAYKNNASFVEIVSFEEE